jgi:sec-independent protein translocase protein TatC
MNKYSMEIRNRLVLVLINGLSTIITACFYKENLLFNVTYQSILKLGGRQPEILYFIFTNVTEVISLYLSVTFFLSYQVLFVYSMYQSFIFLTPALFDKEYLTVRFFLKTLALFYLGSVIFFKYILLPVSFRFFLSFKKVTINNSFCLYFEAKITEYFKFFIVLYRNNGLYFQIFAFVFLSFNYFNTPVNIKKSRKLFYYFFLLLVFFICSAELLIQISIILFFMLFYELIIIFLILKYSFYFYRQRK